MFVYRAGDKTGLHRADGPPRPRECERMVGRGIGLEARLRRNTLHSLLRCTRCSAASAMSVSKRACPSHGPQTRVPAASRLGDVSEARVKLEGSRTWLK